MKITEYIDNMQTDQVEENVIKNVLVLGPKSKNGRKYTKKCMKDAVGLYENAKVFVNHSEGPRNAEDRFGNLQNLHISDEGIRGDLQFLGTHPLADRVKEDVSKNLSCYGLSHVVDGRAKKTQEGITVHEISDVLSVDIVAQPATTVNLLEEIEVDEEKVEVTEAEQVAEIMAEEIENTEKLNKITEILGVQEEVVEEPVSDVEEQVDELKELKEELEQLKKSIETNTYIKPKAPVIQEQVVDLKAIGASIRGDI